MARTYCFERQQFIARPLDEVFAFFSDASNLGLITPDWLHFRIFTPQPIAMQAGTLIDYQIKLFSVPMRWRTRIDYFDPPHQFIDRQVRGPYKFWLHTHEFKATDGGTLITDRVEYQLRLGPIGWIANKVFVARTLARIFDHRAETITRLLVVEDRSTADAGLVKLI